MAANFSKKLKEIVNGIKTGVQLFKDFISGRLSLKKIVDDIVLAVTTIPDKVSQFKIAKPSQKLNCREFTYSLFVSTCISAFLVLTLVWAWEVINYLHFFCDSRSKAKISILFKVSDP